MAVFSGKNGKVLAGASTVLDVTKWEFNDEANTHRYASSATGGYKKTVAGTQQGDGSIDYKQSDSSQPTLRSGMSVTLKLYEDTTHFWIVPAVIKSNKRSVDIDSGEEVGGTASFESDGSWTEPTRP
jgi:hypothetical protein